MSLSSLLAAYLIAQGSHTAGHFYEANKNNAPIHLDAGTLSESWKIPNMKNQDERRRINDEIEGGGFANQDFIRDLIDNPKTSKNVSLMNAIIKGAYLSGLPTMMSNDIKGGDIERLKEFSGNKLTPELVGASAIMDLWKSQHPGQKWSVDFIAPEGAPGLMFTTRF